MVKGLSRVIALSANIEPNSEMELLYDKKNSELFGFKHSKHSHTPRCSFSGENDSGLNAVLLATLEKPVTAAWILNKLFQYDPQAVN
ncbi:MAG: hypothetical protein J6M93_00425 [Succinivibrio sp.]|nr:hypothetical protein [Succinivibrio sp.]